MAIAPNVLRHRRAAVVVATALAVAGPLHADEDCSRFATQTEMNQCAGRNLAAADAELNRVYRQVVAQLAGDEAALARLRTAQRAWIAFRDAECGFAASRVAGGSIYPMIHAGCVQSQTEARSAVLNGYLSCAEGDLACPLPPR